MHRFLSFFLLFLMLIGSAYLSIAQTVSHSGKCHISKELKVKYAKEAILKSTYCQHKNHSKKCSDCGVNCCQVSVIGFVTDMTQPIQDMIQKILFSYLSPIVKNFHKGLFRPPIA